MRVTSGFRANPHRAKETEAEVIGTSLNLQEGTVNLRLEDGTGKYLYLRMSPEEAERVIDSLRAGLRTLQSRTERQ